MSTKTEIGTAILRWAIIVGIGAEWLLNGVREGVNVALVVLALVVAAEWIARRGRVEMRRESRGLFWLAPVFGLGIAWRDSSALAALDIGCIVIIAVLAALRGRVGSLGISEATEYPRRAPAVMLEMAFGVFPLLRRDVVWSEAVVGERPKSLLSVLKGVLLAVPFLFLFGALFSSADPAFDHLLSVIFQWPLENLWNNLWPILVCFALTAGILRSLLLKEHGVADSKRPRDMELGSGEILVALGLLNLLFLLFVAVQFRFLFGGGEAIHAVTGLTYAEYARGGFFELAWVSLLVLPTLLLLHWLLREPTPSGQRTFRILATSLVVLLFVIMGSALERMHLYVEAYGLTELRLYVTVFMAWLAVVFVWFLTTVLRERRDRFSFGAIVAAFGVVAFLHVLNPDALIVRCNAERASSPSGFDIGYASDLSADAVPELIASIPRIAAPADRAAFAQKLLGRAAEDDDADWRSWNWSRQTARSAIRRNRVFLTSEAKPPGH